MRIFSVQVLFQLTFAIWHSSCVSAVAASSRASPPRRRAGRQSARWESNPLLQLGRLGYYRYTTGATFSLESNGAAPAESRRVASAGLPPHPGPAVSSPVGAWNEGVCHGHSGRGFLIQGEHREADVFLQREGKQDGDLFLNIVESKKNGEDQFERRQVVVFREDIDAFLEGFEAAVRFIRKGS